MLYQLSYVGEEAEPSEGPGAVEAGFGGRIGWPAPWQRVGDERTELPGRLRRLGPPASALGMRVFVARSARARLLGLAGLTDVPADCALLIPGCRSVHTFGMRFALDVTFVDDEGRELRTVRGLRPGRVAACRGATALLERPAVRR